ncbi:MAG TPA: cupredoxin domain-containing protein [Leptolyngbyaceae cyanobacterium]
MQIKPKIWSSIIGLALVLGINPNLTAMEMPVSQTNRFRKVEQPLPLKVFVTLGGLGLISLELWWFIFSKKATKSAETREGNQEITIQVNGGYEPSQVLVQAGQPVKLKFFRQDSSSCLEKVLLPDFHIAANLPLNQETIVEFTPQTPGEYQFTCGMNMFRGIVKAQ